MSQTKRVSIPKEPSDFKRETVMQTSLKVNIDGINIDFSRKKTDLLIYIKSKEKKVSRSLP